MSKRRVYLPSETHLALYPSSVRILCPCGVRFEPRSSPLPDMDSEDDPKLCLTCNRAQWSRLWNGNQPVDSSVDNSIDSSVNTASDARADNKFDSAWFNDHGYDKASEDHSFEFVSDNDIGEVVSMIDRRPRR